MMTGIIGAVFIEAAFIMAGFLHYSEIKAQLLLEENMRCALNMLSNLISNELLSLGEAFERISADKSVSTVFFTRISLRMGEIGEQTFSDIWEEEVEKLQESAPLVRSCLIELGKILGRYSLNDQLTGIEQCVNTLSQSIDSHRAGLPEVRKISLGIPACLGALLITVLL